MSDLKNFLEVSRLAAFVGGVVAAVVVPRALKSSYAKKAAVYAVAKGMELQDEAVSFIEDIREDARDVYHEARERAVKKAAAKQEV